MHIILGILFIGAFLLFAPKFMKKMVAANIVLAIVYYLALRILALILSAGKGGRNSGLLSEYAIYGIMLMLSVPALMTLGIIIGAITRNVQSNLRKKQLVKSE